MAKDVFKIISAGKAVENAYGQVRLHVLSHGKSSRHNVRIVTPELRRD